jgi:hypothetical protein
MTKQSTRSSTREIPGLSGGPTDAEPQGRLSESRSPRLRRAAFLGLAAMSLVAWVGIIWLLVVWLR